ncbi:MAG: hypothetical protein ABTQ34_03300 [Bdellovibrionales bacterium]
MKKLLLSTAVLCAFLSQSALAATVTLDNSPADDSVSDFGVPDSQTYGEVITAPLTGYLTSFTLYTEGGVGSLYGGVAGWSGGSNYGTGYGSTGLLYTSGVVSSVNTSVDGYTFSPNIPVVAGQQYVLFLSVNLADGTSNSVQGAAGTTSMPLSSVTVPGLNYFVWNNSADGSGPQNNSWNYFWDYGNALTQATFSDVAPVPLPAALPLLGIALGGIGVAGAVGKKRRSAA